jgi:hydroxyethylthiazole kinase-like uncharacterized protein yjeF
MKIAMAAQMREIDRRTIEEYGILSLVLMERAGLAVVNKIREIAKYRKALVLCGAGNNGGDGLVVARLLWNEGWNVKAYLLMKEEKGSPDFKAQLQAAKKFRVPVLKTAPDEKDLHAAVIVDAIFGTGLSKDIKGQISGLIEMINQKTSDGPVIAVDIPSGISSDTGQVMGTAIRADYTVTFGLPKPGHLLYPGASHTGELSVADIGFPSTLLRDESLKWELLEKEAVAALLPDRPRYSHKGTYGHVLLVAGSKGKTGAALLAAKAILKSGAGMATIGVPDELMGVYQSRVTDEMTFGLPSIKGMIRENAAQEILNFLHGKADVLAIGPGLGVSEDTRKLLPFLISSGAAPMVIDADGLNSLKGNLGVLKDAKAPIVLTPHPGEMGRLLDITAGEVEKDRTGSALRLSEETGAYVVLKGAPTVIAEPEGHAYLNPTGTPAMAKAGMGDVLTGMIAGFMAQGVSPLDASILGVYTHGLAGELAARELGLYSLLASDMQNYMPAALKSLYAN